MKLAVMQPYFFPYIGYWQLMEAVDLFVILDDVNYITRGWMHRNRIRVDGRERYIVCPVSNASQNRLICDTQFVGDGKTMANLLATIRYAFRKAPFYSSVDALVEESLLYQERDMTAFLEFSMRQVASYLGISTDMARASSLRGRSHEAGQQGILELCRATGCSVYCNPQGGRALYDPKAFADSGVELRFLEPDFGAMRKLTDEEDLDYSILQLMAYHDPGVLAEMLKCC